MNTYKKQQEMSLAEFPVPESQDLERLVLAELSSDPTVINEARRDLREEYFTNEDRKAIYKYLCECDEHNIEVDIVTLNQRFGKDCFNKEILPQLQEAGSCLTVTRHCKALAESYLRQQSYKMAVKLLQKSTTPGTGMDDIIKLCNGFREAFIEATKTCDTVSVAQAMNSLANSLKEEDRHVTTGFPSLDDLTYGGFEAGQLNILAARPSVGKTAVALYMAQQASIAGKKAHIMSLEMTKEELAKRFLFSMETIRPYDLSKRSVDWNRFEEAISFYENLGIFINESVNSIDEIIAEIKYQVRTDNADIFFIDYLGLIREIAMETEGGRKSNTIAMVTKRLKDLSKELHVPIVLLCQLNRNSVSNASGQPRPPMLADLRDSGAIEQDADVCLMLEPKNETVIMTDPEGNQHEEQVDMLKLWVRKNRNGRRDIAIELKMNKTHTRYTECGVTTE